MSSGIFPTFPAPATGAATILALPHGNTVKAVVNCGFGRERLKSRCLTSVCIGVAQWYKSQSLPSAVFQHGPSLRCPTSCTRVLRLTMPLTQCLCFLSDPFVKIQLVHGLKLTKTKKTSCMRGTIDPFYNESFSFKVPQEELENASLVFTGKHGGY